MAESLLLNLAESVLGKLGSLVLEEFFLVWRLESDLEQIKKLLKGITAVLLDAEQQQSQNHRIQVWLEELKDVLYDIEDVVDEFECEGLRRQVVKAARNTTRKIRRYLSSSNPLAFCFRMAYKLKNIRERVGKLVKLKSDFGLTEGVNDRQVISKKRKLTHSFVDAATVIGRDGDKENIIDHLLNPVDVENVSILPIVGLGGLGKTTLAKLVYNDQRVQNHFKIKVWACIFDDFDLQEVLRTIIQAATSQECKGWDIEKLQAFLRETVNNKKYLLILDDVWNEDRRKWNELRALLMGGAKGSWIIVTTRKNSVVSLMANVPPYNLNVLSYKNCLSLFLKCAFKDGQEVKHYPNLVRIGEEIVRKCKGVPLAVETLGNLLYSITSEREWKSVRDKEIWKLEQKEDDIMSALTISYEQLPSYLKRCFAYCSFFPKDHTYSDFRLIYFWMAHGLLQSKNEHEELEDVGLRYFKELCSRSFFQDFDQLIGLVRCKRMADLMHDLALSLTQKECSIVTSETQQIPGNVRHLLFADLNSLPKPIPMSLQGLDSVRTIAPFVDSEFISQSFLQTYLPRFQFLRYLDLRHSEIEILPEGVGVLKHLRFLSLSVSKMRRLPNSICKLQSLQTLWLKGCDGIEELPSDMRCFISLRSLSITTKQKLFPNDGIGCLKSLRCLEIYLCENVEYLFEDMHGLASLRKLSIVNCSSLKSLPQSMKYLTALEVLVINGCENLDLEMEEEESNNEQDLTQFCRLEKVILGYLPKLVEFPRWLLNSYSNTLQFFRLVNCYNLKEWPACPTCVQELDIDHCGRFTTRDDWSSIAHVPKILINGVQLQPTARNCGTSYPSCCRP
ncbi:putative disease resistance protein RGA1 [Mercurialis annua]|uniref:putative disease resistance protein RGA1 n=1 Tax=Mercurialis annua TaxID=3986 RepID=UPI0024AFA389|nr:putative disease resistance protein RGA1 [Mercurialis annua]